MSLNKNIKQSGFTIVELLIVIVVIGILAAITIVAYNGIQNRARATTSKSMAQNVVKKAEAYNADKGTYPAALADLTGAAATETYAIPSGSVNQGTPDATNGQNTVNWVKLCTAATGGTQSGVQITYFTYPGTATMTAGTGVTGTC